MKKYSLIDKSFFLKQTPLFEALDLDLLLPIADKLEMVEYANNDIIFRKGDEAYKMYLILSGKIKILDETENLLAELESISFFGEEAIFNQKPRSYSAICSEKALLFTLSRTHLLNILHECPSVAVAFLKVYSQTLAFRPRITEDS